VAVEPGRCPACGEAPHGDAPCGARPLAELRVFGPCDCLPEPEDAAWSPCAACGLVQAPGKTFCGYCGSRWVAATATG
jgi:hypothetical protein